MDGRDFYPQIEPVDVVLSSFFLDPNKDDGKKNDARNHRDRINVLLSSFSDDLQRRINDIKEDYKKRIQSEIDAINRIVQS